MQFTRKLQNKSNLIKDDAGVMKKFYPGIGHVAN